MDADTVVALTRIGQETAIELIPLFISRNSDGSVKKISAGIFLEEADTAGRNEETLKKIAEANKQE